MVAWEHGGFSIEASLRITLRDRDVPRSVQSLEHLLRYCARPPFAFERLSVIRRAAGKSAWSGIVAAFDSGLGAIRKPRAAVSPGCLA